MADITYNNPVKIVKPYHPRQLSEGVNDTDYLWNAYKMMWPVLIVGEAGAGKTESVVFTLSQIEKRLSKEHHRDIDIAFIRVNMNGGTTTQDFIGQWIPASGGFKWNDGILTRFMREAAAGKDVCILIDEINAAPTGILFVLNSLLDRGRQIILTEKDGEVLVDRDKSGKSHLWIVATMNPPWYEGVRPLNQALHDRFPVHLYYDYNTDYEAKLLKKYPHMIKLAKKIREMRNISTPVSTRALEQFVETADLMGEGPAMYVFQNRFTKDEQVGIGEFMEII